MLQIYFYFQTFKKYAKLTHLVLDNSFRDVPLSRNGPGRDAGRFVPFHDCPG